MRSFATLFVLPVFFAGCSALPGTGPATHDISSQIDAHQSWYQVVDIDENVIASLHGRAAPSFLAFSQYKAASEPVIGAGDIIRLTVWEAAPGNLFSATLTTTSSAGTTVGGTTIPDQVVPHAGTISVPFAGEVHVAGKSPREVENIVQKKLRAKSVDPQVLVNIVKSLRSMVTVTGDAIGGSQVQLGPGNEHVLDAIAQVGGLKMAEHETFVTLVRNNKSVTLSFSELTNNPAENILLASGDLLLVNKRPRTYTILGAVTRNAEVPFEARNITLGQAVARAGGLTDDRADATGVFIFRYEKADQVASLLQEPVFVMPGSGKVAVIYRLNLRDPKGLFFAQAFPIFEGDMIYVSDAPAAELAKFLAIINSTAQPAISGAVAYNAVNPVK